MRDRAVLDTGVIVAIYFDEDASERAVEVASKHSPITLDLAVAEVGNAAWKRERYLVISSTVSVVSQLTVQVLWWHLGRAERQDLIFIFTIPRSIPQTVRTTTSISRNTDRNMILEIRKAICSAWSRKK